MKKDLLANAGFYYQVGDFKSFSKNECFIVAKGDASKISFYQAHFARLSIYTITPSGFPDP